LLYDLLVTPRVFFAEMDLDGTPGGHAVHPRSRMGRGAPISTTPRAPGLVVATSSAPAPPFEKPMYAVSWGRSATALRLARMSRPRLDEWNAEVFKYFPAFCVRVAYRWQINIILWFVHLP
jgi:hypothetical protein